ARVVVQRRGVVAGAWTVLAALLIPFARGADRRLDLGARVPDSESARVAELLGSRVESPFARYAVLVVRGVDVDRDGDRMLLRGIEDRIAASTFVTETRSILDRPDTLFRGSGTTFMIVGLTDAQRPDSIIASLRAISVALLPRLRRAHP